MDGTVCLSILLKQHSKCKKYISYEELQFSQQLPQLRFSPHRGEGMLQWSHRLLCLLLNEAAQQDVTVYALSGCEFWGCCSEWSDRGTKDRHKVSLPCGSVSASWGLSSGEPGGHRWDTREHSELSGLRSAPATHSGLGYCLLTVAPIRENGHFSPGQRLASPLPRW